MSFFDREKQRWVDAEARHRWIKGEEFDRMHETAQERADHDGCTIEEAVARQDFERTYRHEQKEKRHKHILYWIILVLSLCNIYLGHQLNEADVLRAECYSVADVDYRSCLGQ